MGNNLARQLIADHLVEGEMRPREEIALKIDQFLTHDMCGHCVLFSLRLWASRRYPGMPLSRTVTIS